jgi:hypothetical protein
VGSDILTASIDVGRRNGVRACLRSTYNKGIGNGGRTTGMSIYHLKRRLRRGVRACDDLKTFGNITYVELANVLGVHGICKTEVLARLYV